MIEILSRWTKAVVYRSETATTVSQAVVEAVTQGADLQGVLLRYANLRYANLRYANLQGANLQGADLQGADLQGADLQGANLRYANLRYANLQGANLQGANLQGADLQGADLQGANLQGANLRYANLQGADLQGVKNIPAIAAAQSLICPGGEIIGWKKCQRGVIVKLKIPADSRRSNATGRKCRCEFADVLEVTGCEIGVSQHDPGVTYRVGQRVTCHEWCEDRWQECAGGIHFFITREEAEAY